MDVPKTGLVLSGGGARGAYQAGVLKGLTEIAAQLNIKNPFPIVTGVSAGAINGAYYASASADPVRAAKSLCEMWSRLESSNIFKTDALTAGRSGFKLIMDAAVGAMYSKKLARSLLDTEPLRELLSKNIEFANIKSNVDQGHLIAFAITAMNYSNSLSETFIVGGPETTGWERARRVGYHTEVRPEHVMASASIPLFFPPVQIGHGHYGDGCIRNTAPLSPAIHLGSDQVLVVSVRKPDSFSPKPIENMEPSFARVFGVILNALMLDAIDLDMERMMRVNSTIQHLSKTVKGDLDLKPINWLWIRPSQDMGHLATENFDRLPSVIRYLMGGLGSSRESSELVSYLLFDPESLKSIIDLGYKDAMDMKIQVSAFLRGERVEQAIHF